MKNFPLGFLGLLTCIFAAAKAFGYLTWSWWWVFSPLWIGIPAAFALLAIFFLIVFISAVIKDIRRSL